MSKRKILAFAAGAAVVVGMAGGGTFANYNDTDTVAGNSIDADVLELDLLNEQTTSGATPIVLEDMGPGEGSFQRLYVATKQDDTERSPAKLSMELVNPVEMDNGCNDPESDVDTTCDDSAAFHGELGQNVFVTIQTFRATETSPGVYDADFSNAGRIASLQTNVKLADLYNNGFDLHTFSPADPDVVAIQVWWTVPGSAGNIIQSDSSAFDINYTLEQVI